MCFSDIFGIRKIRGKIGKKSGKFREKFGSKSTRWNFLKMHESVEDDILNRSTGSGFWFSSLKIVFLPQKYRYLFGKFLDFSQNSKNRKKRENFTKNRLSHRKYCSDSNKNSADRRRMLVATNRRYSRQNPRSICHLKVAKTISRPPIFTLLIREMRLFGIFPKFRNSEDS